MKSVYPMPLPKAKARLRELERQIRVVDEWIARGPTLDLEKRRRRLEAEYDPLYEALDVIASHRLKKICVCYKVVHNDRPSALAHLRALRLVSEPDPIPELLHAYRCDYCNGWHVGHARKVSNG